MPNEPTSTLKLEITTTTKEDPRRPGLNQASGGAGAAGEGRLQLSRRDREALSRDVLREVGREARLEEVSRRRQDSALLARGRTLTRSAFATTAFSAADSIASDVLGAGASTASRFGRVIQAG